SSELLQISEVVLIKQPDIRRPRPKHRQSFYAPAEGETLIFRGVVADAPQHVRMHHAASCRFDPAVAAAYVALGIATLALEAVERDLGRGLGEWEVVDAEADLPIAPEDLARERVERPLEVRHGELLVDREALVLEEDRLADRVGRLVPVAPAGNDDTDRGLSLLHHAHLHRRGVRPV